MNIPNFFCVIHVDRHQLSQVVRNLVSNAIKFSTEESTIKVSVDVISSNVAEKISGSNENRSIIVFKKERADYYVRFSVTDTGPGISRVGSKITKNIFSSNLKPHFLKRRKIK